MEKSLFQFIWKYSKRDQIILLLLTLLTLPVLYISLELPKRIINDAIDSKTESVDVLGFTLSQVHFLWVLCVCFLLVVVITGVMKMRLNTMKGVLSERLLRRFRFQMLSRVHRFPRTYFQKTSQGELASMVTSEAEPMGSLMGELLSQPVLLIGQMFTILVFLFAQSFWFGLASIAVIPLQAWIIPKLQHQINLLNKNRTHEVRKLAGDIGETAAGVSDIRINGGLRYRLSLLSSRLGTLYDIRFEIFQKKFFMKFLNNFLGQLTPLFFYSVGGYLAIKGQITVGALVAALAAYKDLSNPWKELLAYYNTTQDMSLRWEVITERFEPKTLVADKLFEGSPDENIRLKGDIEFANVTVRDERGQTVLEDINLTIPQGARVAVKTKTEAAALAFADLLTREVIPQYGSIKVAGHNMNTLHQETLANCIGYAHSDPNILSGTMGENLFMPFKHKPILAGELPTDIESFRKKAEQSGNSADPFDVDWIDPGVAGLTSSEEVQDWWFQLVEAMGIDDFMVRRALRSTHEINALPELAKAIVKLRPEVAKRLEAADLTDVIEGFHPDKFNAVSLLASNLLYALPTRVLSQQALSQEENFVPILRDEGIAEELAELSSSLIEGLNTTFGDDGTDHPLFRRLNMEQELYKRLSAIVVKRRVVSDDELPPEDYALLLTVPFAFSAEQIGPAFSDNFKERVLHIRKKNASHMVESLDGLFEPIDPQTYYSVMTLLGNAIFGRISNMAGARRKQIEDVVVEVLREHGLWSLAARSVYDLETTPGGDNLPAVFRERLAFSRAGIKKPDILILSNALASHDGEARELAKERVSKLLPETTKIFIEKEFINPESYDVAVEIVDGRIDGGTRQADPKDIDVSQDLNRKLAVIAKTELFDELDLKQQRLLAFSAQWYRAAAGKVIFAMQQEADAAYLCVEGHASLSWRTDSGENRLITEITPGRLIGDLAVIENQPRRHDLTATEDSLFLRIGATELLSIIENDAKVAASLLRSVAGHLNSAATSLRALQTHAAEQGVDLSSVGQDNSEQSRND